METCEADTCSCWGLSSQILTTLMTKYLQFERASSFSFHVRILSSVLHIKGVYQYRVFYCSRGDPQEKTVHTKELFQGKHFTLVC